jgi:hypothetical protein
MAALSVFIEDGVPPHLCANSVFVIAREGDILIFEVLERDVSRLLKTLVGKPELYSLGGQQTFFATLLSLEPCQSTSEALALMREVPAMRGVFSIPLVPSSEIKA